jgi:hypothetical protein
MPNEKRPNTKRKLTPTTVPKQSWWLSALKWTVEKFAIPIVVGIIVLIAGGWYNRAQTVPPPAQSFQAVATNPPIGSNAGSVHDNSFENITSVGGERGVVNGYGSYDNHFKNVKCINTKECVHNGP